MDSDPVQHVQVSRAGAFPVGTIVSRDGTDRHRVIAVNDVGDLIEVECIVRSAHGWCDVGEREWNLPRRYTRASL